MPAPAADTLDTSSLRPYAETRGLIIRRGRDWERAVHRKFGTVPPEDQAMEVAALCGKSPELVRDRVGIIGWSFGGYMPANAVLRRPDVFKAAVAGTPPVTDWQDHDTHYTERYLGLLHKRRAA